PGGGQGIVSRQSPHKEKEPAMRTRPALCVVFRETARTIRAPSPCGSAATQYSRSASPGDYCSQSRWPADRRRSTARATSSQQSSFRFGCTLPGALPGTETPPETRRGRPAPEPLPLRLYQAGTIEGPWPGAATALRIACADLLDGDLDRGLGGHFLAGG